MIDEQPWQIEHPRHPCDDTDDMKSHKPAVILQEKISHCFFLLLEGSQPTVTPVRWQHFQVGHPPFFFSLPSKGDYLLLRRLT
jgi:hypothetical protein